MTTQKFRLLVFLTLPITTLFFLLFTKTNAIDVVDIKNKAYQIKNEVNTHANTGNNETNGGSIITGDANAGSVVTNVVNTNVVKNCCGTPTPTPKPTVSPTPTNKPTPTPTPTPTHGPTPTPTPGSSNNGGGGNTSGNGGGGIGGASISTQPRQGEVLGLSATSGEISASQFAAQLTQLVTFKSATARIVIPRLGINLPVVEAQIINGYWQVSENSASHGAGSANPGEAGNAVIFAHAREGLFAPLRNVAVHDEIYVLTKDRWLRYAVAATTLVHPDQTGVVAPTPDERLTLFTCSGFADSKRLIVTALPVAL